MSNQISLTIPNDDPIALRAFGNALEEMAVAHGAEVRKPVIISQKHTIGDMSVETVMQGITEPSHPYQHAVLDADSAPFTDDTIDADGLPWDARIHSGNQERNADNTWRVRRRPKDLTPEQWAEQVAQVRDELFALMAIPVAVSVDPAVAGGDYSVEAPVNTDGLNDLPETHLNGMVCSVCHELQYDSPYGTTCKNGHGGVEGIEPFEISNESPAAVFGAPVAEIVTVSEHPVVVEQSSCGLSLGFIIQSEPLPPIADPVPPAPAPLPPVAAADPVPPAPALLPPVTAAAGVPATLAELMTWLTSKAPSDDAGRAARLEQINGIVARHGLVTLGQLQKRLDLIPQVYADLVKELGQ